MIRSIINNYKSLSVGAKSTIWYTFANIMQKGINVIVIPIYTRLLTPEQYGVYSVFISWMEIFEIIVTFRLFMGAYVVGLVKFDNEKESYTSSLEKLSIIITTISLIIYLFFQKYVNKVTELTTPLILLMFAMMYAAPIIGFWKAWQRVDNRYIGMVLLTLVISLLTPIFGIASIIFIHSGEIGVLYSRALVEILIALFLIIIYRNIFNKKTNIVFWKYALHTNIPLIPYYLSLIVLNHSDRIVIQKLVGFSEAGIYSVAYSAAMIMTLFTNSFNSSLQPWLFKQLKIKKYLTVPKIISTTLLLIAVLNLMLIAVSPEIIIFMVPEQYHEAIWIIPPLAASVFLMACYQNFINIEFYYNESRITAIASIGTAFLNIILNLWLIPIYGYLAAGYTTLISYIIFFMTHLIFVKKVCKRNHCPVEVLDIKQMFLILVLFFLICTVLMFGYIVSLLRYAVIGSICVTLFIKRNSVLSYIKNFWGYKHENNI